MLIRFWDAGMLILFAAFIVYLAKGARESIANIARRFDEVEAETNGPHYDFQAAHHRSAATRFEAHDAGFPHIGKL